ncbi:MAG: Ig-like domain-containing protein [Candidatus Promineifilaceae bacterium]|nr:Ig-like domain-containing protein [Candidatus Promineifilaceae bacterium]
MRKSTLIRILILLSLMAIVLIACRREEEPTPTPETPSVSAEPTEEADETAPTPTEEPEPTEEPTPEPAAAIAPEDIDWSPQVIASNPVPGEEVALDSPIAIRFDQPMDQDSVEMAWTMEPSTEGEFAWPREDTVIFTPAAELKRAQNYLVRISDDASAKNGLAIEQAVELNLQTIGDLEVNQVIPANSTEDVQAHAAITVVFNRPVVPLVSSDQQADLPQPLVLSPAVKGTGTWISTSIYRFEPGSEGLAGATTYQATIEEGLSDASGAVLPDSFSWQFTTQNPEVVQIQPPNGAALVEPGRPITVTFNMPMERSSTEAAVSLQPSEPVTYEWHENDEVLVLKPQDQLQLETSYQLTIDQSASSANGQTNLDESFESAFTVLPFPAVIRTSPSNGVTADSWQRGVGIEFASPMDFATLEDRIRIDPEPENVRYEYYQWIDEISPEHSSFNLYLDFDLERNTDYTITVPGDAADPYGNTLGEDYTWQFSAAGFAPVASFNLVNPLSQISTSFPSDVDVIHRNVSQLEVNLHDLELPLEQLNQPYLANEIPLPPPLRTWSLPVETASDEIGITTISLADGDALAPGVYFLTVSAPEIPSESSYWQNQRVMLIVADTNLVVKEMPDEVHVWSTDLETGEPVSGRNVALYSRIGNEIGTAVTDNSGFAMFEYTPPEGYQEGVLAISNAPGEEGFGAASSIWMGQISPWNMGLNYGYSNPLPQFTYLYTDRPIYRPGDTVYFKGIVRDSNFGRYSLPEEETLELQIGPLSFFQEGSPLEDTIPVTVNAEGIFSGEYVLPEDMLLGSYSLYLHDETMDLSRSFTVAEYRKPEFQVTLTPETDEVLRGEEVDVNLEATYFFGGSAAGLQVNWSIYEDTYRPEVPGPYYAFGDEGDFYYEDPGLFGRVGGGTFGRYVLGDSGTTDENGNLTITLPADLLQDVEEGSRKVTVEATVQDITNFPVTANSSVIFHSADGYVGIRPTEFMPLAGTEASVDLLTVDWAGEPLSNQDIEVVFYQREWERLRNADFGVYFTEWEAIDTEVERVQVTTDAQGKGQASFVPEDGGTYLAVATLTDSAGRQQVSSTTLWVIDQNFAGWRTDPKQRTMDLVADKDEYRVGETARILVQSPFTVPVKAWLTVERGNLLEQQVITLDGGSAVLDLPISADYAPNAFVSVVAIKPVTEQDEDNPFADIRLGVTELTVPPDQFALNVNLTPREELFAPGDTAVYDILITDNEGSGVAADFSLALVDLAVLTLKDDNAPPILEAFYSPQPYRSQVGSGLFVTGEGLEPEIPLEGGGLGGGGGDGMAESALAKLDTEEDDARSEFPDTAFWEASVKSDGDGQATVEIPLPDSLTTWRLSSKAVTNDTKVGQNEVDVVVTLPLLVRPVTPRFFTAGDKIFLGAVVNNNTDSAIAASVTLEADGVALVGETVQTINVPAGGSQLVRWEADVEDVPFVDLTFRVEGDGYRDASKPPLGVGPDNLIPVYRYNAQDFTGTAGELDEAGRRVEAVLLPPNADTSRGSVDMQLNPSLAAALIDALAVVEKSEDSTDCAHAITDRLLPNLATDQAISQLNLDEADLTVNLAELIAQDITTLAELQKRGGGWGWCYSAESDPWLSAYALLALARADASGYDVSALVVNRAQNYVGNQLKEMDEINNAWDANRQAFLLYVLAESGQDIGEEADALFEAHRGLLDPYAKALLIMAYDANGSTGSNVQTLLADLNDEVVLSATGAHWEDAEQDFFNLNSDVRGTAMVIDALSRVDAGNTLLPNAVRWLMAARTAQVWSTGHETAWSITALANWMQVSEELLANYDYEVLVNGVSLTDGQFTPSDVMSSEEFSLPVNTLLSDETNFIDLQRGAGDGRLYYTMHLNSFINAESVDATSRGLTVQRVYYDADCDPETDTCEPIEQIAAGERVRVELTIVAPDDLLYLIVEDPFPAGAEGIDPGLNISASGFEGEVERQDPEFRYGYWGWWYFNRIEYRDEKVVFLSNFLPAGTYQYTYTLQTAIPGEFQVMPAIGYQEFFPEVFGRSEGMRFEITGE